MDQDTLGPLIHLLQLCTVAIENNRAFGTGFFVSPGRVITCSHVVEDAQESGSPICISYQGNRYDAGILQYEDKHFPDLALLNVDIAAHPCVLLSPEIQRDDEVYGFGYPEEFQGGDGISGEYEADSWFDEARTQELVKFSDTRVVPGFSGGPLLNLRTGAVCGVIKRSLGEDAPVGGRAVPISYALDRFQLKPLQEAFHAKDSRWRDAVSEAGALKGMGDQAYAQDVLVYEAAGNRFSRERLYGRDEMIATVNAWIDAGQRVLLYGFPASGKTVLAATIADHRLAAGKGKYMWLHIKDMSQDEVLDVLARRFSTEKDRERFATLSKEAIIQALGGLLAQSGIKLCVIDDAEKGDSLNLALAIAPRGMSVLITSRTNFGSGKLIDNTLDVGDIAQPAALDMLVEKSGKHELYHDPFASRLLQVLGYHPYSIEIAGLQLRSSGGSAQELLEMIEGRPYDLEMPGAFAEHGRESMKKLLDAVVVTLETPTQDPDRDQANQAILSIFRAFGAFFASGATIDLLSCYLGWKTGEVIRALRGMAEISLARQQPGTRYFDIHDLVFCYARALWARENRSDYAKSLAAITAFLENHPTDYALLASEIDNVKGAALQALTDDPEIFLQIVSFLACSGYMENRGYSLDLLQLLDRAIGLARQKGQPETLHYLQSKRGNAHYNRLELAQAARCYEEALTLAPNWQRAMKLLAVLGKVDTRQGKQAEAVGHFQQSLNIVEEHNHPEEQGEYLGGRIFILQQQSDAAHQMKDYRRARDLVTEGLALAQKAGDAATITLFRTDLGTLEIMVGAQAALTMHQQVLADAQQASDRQVLATAYYGLAVDYLVLDEYAQARECFLQARQLFEEFGDLDKLNQLKLLEKSLSGG